MTYSDSWTSILLAANDLTLTAILVVGFSLLAYIALHNWRNAVARSFCLLLASLLVVLGGAVLLRQARTAPTIQALWRIQWLGIALTPAAYCHFAFELLRSTGEQRRWWRPLVAVLYVASAAFWGLAIATELVVARDILGRPLAPFGAGPLFWVFVAFFIGATGAGFWHIRRAGRRAITPATRRRLMYLSASFLAPMLGVLPYLMIAAWANWVPLWLLLMLFGASTTGTGIMMTVMAYSVAFHGVIVPDRIVKYNFLRYILYGPTVGVVLVICLQLLGPLTEVTGLPRDTITVLGVMVMTVLMPIFIQRIRPTVDMLLYRQDRAEMRWMRNIEQRAFTRSDLRQLLENTLVAICGTFGAESGFVAAPGEDGFLVQASCGPRRAIKHFLSDHGLQELVQTLEEQPAKANDPPETGDFTVLGNFCLLALRNTNNQLIGAIGVACRPEQLTQEARRLIGSLAHQMEFALTHMQLQQDLFNSLRGLSPQTESLLQMTTELESPAGEPPLLSADVALHPEFNQRVKDALTHYWGGPKLSDSPLLELRTVRHHLDQQGGSPTRALQNVLRQAIENIRPNEQLDPTAPEWMLYNILEMRFLKGLRIREIVDKLAMSESDFYRKQRVAVEEVARQLAMMEEQGERPSLR
ncbi:MAG TPA: histidine kinase N-terminal 7TM domain-containing protein [Herpetosiphonaceae bacterium]|nr:histidine kinase N-terminal 7TM domain-containing protein [Herpetosiphonaceae bacterium]